MSSVFQSFQAKQGLPLSRPDCTNKEERRLSSLSLKIQLQPISTSPAASWAFRRVSMRDRSKNRKPLQKGRSLSIEAIQTVQALKRAKPSTHILDQAFRTSFRRLLKLDMIAVLRELLRQNQCHLALKVFELIRKEDWYKPQLSLYAELVLVLGSNGLLADVELLFIKLKEESSLEPDIDGFNALLESLTIFNLNGLAVECYYLMRSVGCDPDRLSFKLLISSLQSNGEVSQLAILRQEAKKYYGESLNFEDEKAGTTINSYSETTSNLF